MRKLEAAKGRVLITPREGTPIAGNVRLDNKSRGVHDNLYCNILILKDGMQKVCLLGFDLIFLEYNTCYIIKSRIEKATDIKATNIIMWATHTHSGPDTGMRLYQDHAHEDPQVGTYIEEMSERVIKGVVMANWNFEYVTLKASAFF
jgi:neutral ceramidase